MNTAASTSTPAASASGSTTPGKATAAATAAIASSPGVAKPAPEMSLTPGLEQLSADEIMAAFMGSPVVSPESEQKEGTKTKEKPKAKEGEDTGEESESDEGAEEEESEADEEEEDEAPESDEGAEEEESEADDEEEGEEKKEDPLKAHPKLRKRFQKLLAENPELKRQVKALTERLEARSLEPEIVSAPNVFDPLAKARTEAEVDTLAIEVATAAKAKLRWLNKHSDGGIWQEGTEQAMEMSAEQVESAIEHYEDLMAKIDTAKSDRKAWLKTYGETVKVLGADKVTALVKPTVATRESELFTKVPELMRDARFLELLADAQAGRETREKMAKGIKFVEVKAGKSKPKEGEEEPGKGGSKAAGADKARPQQQQKTPVKETVKTPLTKTALDKLRQEAAAGNRSAQDALMNEFLGGA